MTTKRSTKPKPFCFVVMPFDESFRDTYELGIKQACEDAGAYCERVDEQKYDEPILDRIYNQISKADVIVADMSDRNPNVFYEVGYAHALGKRVVLLTRRASDIPFDLTRYWHLVYEGSITDLKSKLTDRIRWMIENPEEQSKETRVFDVRVNGKQLSEDGIEIDVSTKDVRVSAVGLEIAIKNVSKRFVQPGECRLGFIFPPNISISSVDWKELTFIWNANPLHICMLPEIGAFFPGEIKLAVPDFNVRISEIATRETMFTRLFLKDGFMDFPVSIVFNSP